MSDEGDMGIHELRWQSMLNRAFRLGGPQYILLQVLFLRYRACIFPLSVEYI